VSTAPSLLNNQSASLASINNISPAIVQKIIAQQPPPQQPPTQQQGAFSQTPRPPQNQPSTAQLRMLVQQIQMAVQAGYLNHQVSACLSRMLHINTSGLECLAGLQYISGPSSSALEGIQKV
jgi:hypothetical protein